jgi:hypothetical protein
VKCADWSAVGAAAGAGALSGLLGFALAGLAIPTGVGFGLTVAGGALIGVVTGQAYRAVELAILGQRDQIPSELGHIDDMLIDGLIGGAGGAVGYGITKAFNSVFGCSFSEDTEVATSEGDKEISEVETGDEVLAYDQENDSIGYYPVTATISEEHQVIINLVIDGEWIKTTPEHPFYTEELGWVKAGELRSGMHVMKSDLESGLVWLVWKVHESQSMYNLTVDTAHTYFVGDGQWLVHNTCPIKAYDVGFSDDLYTRSPKGDQLDVHHAPQSHLAAQSIPGYNPSKAPAIALPHDEHVFLNRLNERGLTNYTSRDLLIKTIRDLRRNTKVPASALRQLVLLWKQNYPNLFGQ